MRPPVMVSQSVDDFGTEFARRADRRYPVLTRKKLTVTATATISSSASGAYTSTAELQHTWYKASHTVASLSSVALSCEQSR
jgi:hypothetical protein